MISNQIASQDAINAVVKWNGEHFTGVADANINYFTVDAADFTGATYLEFTNIKEGTSTLITIKSTDVKFVPQSGNFDFNNVSAETT